MLLKAQGSQFIKEQSDRCLSRASPSAGWEEAWQQGAGAPPSRAVGHPGSHRPIRRPSGGKRGGGGGGGARGDEDLPALRQSQRSVCPSFRPLVCPLYCPSISPSSIHLFVLPSVVRLAFLPNFLSRKLTNDFEPLRPAGYPRGERVWRRAHLMPRPLNLADDQWLTARDGERRRG